MLVALFNCIIKSAVFLSGSIITHVVRVYGAWLAGGRQVLEMIEPKEGTHHAVWCRTHPGRIE